MSTIGGPRLSTIPKFTNTYSMDFDGVDDYVQAKLVNGDSIIAGSKTISWWMKLDQYNTTEMIMSIRGTSGADYFSVRKTSSGVVSFGCRGAVTHGRSADTTKYDVTTLTDWTHFLVTKKLGLFGRGEIVKIFINGVDVTGGLATVNGGSANEIKIGQIGNIGYMGSLLHGSVDELAVFDGHLDSPAEVTSIYNGGIPTDLTDKNPLVWYRMGDNGSWKSPQWLLPNNENKEKVSNYSLSFDGIDDYVELGSLPNLQNATQYSISSWFKTPFNNQYQVIYSWFDGADGYLQLVLVDDGSFVVYNYRTSTAYGLSATGLVSANTWCNALVVFEGSGATNADRLKLYVNGNPISLTYTGTVPTQTGTMLQNGLHLAAYVTTSGTRTWELEGNIDEVSIFDSAISIGDVWDGSGEPIDVSAVSGLKQYYKMGEEANFTSNWLVDNSALTNYSKRSFEFDGVGDYIDCGSSGLSGETALSISAWVYPKSYGGAAAESFVSTDSTSPRGFYIGVYNATNFRFAFTTNGSNLTAINTAAGTVDLNVWQHILVTWDQVNLKLYKNGVLLNTVPTTFASNGTFTTTNNLLIGVRQLGNVGLFEGNIDEVSIFNTVVDIADVWDGSGEPIDVSAVSGIVSNYRMGEDASFNGTDWTIPDQAGDNNGTSDGMMVDALVGEAPNYTGGGISEGMDIEDRVGNAPNSGNNTLSINMEREDRVEDTP